MVVLVQHMKSSRFLRGIRHYFEIILIEIIQKTYLLALCLMDFLILAI